MKSFDVSAPTRDRANLPVIMVTAQAGSSYIGGAMQAGADDYVIKPFDPDELLAHIRAVLRRGAS